MKKIEITINGEKYPCRQTMGAMLRFKQETGKEVTEMEGLSDWVAFLYCCIVSATKYDTKKDFPLSLMDFADSVSSDMVVDWVKAVSGDNAGKAGTAEKKSTRR